MVLIDYDDIEVFDLKISCVRQQQQLKHGSRQHHPEQHRIAEKLLEFLLNHVSDTVHTAMSE